MMKRMQVINEIGEVVADVTSDDAGTFSYTPEAPGRFTLRWYDADTGEDVGEPMAVTTRDKGPQA